MTQPPRVSRSARYSPPNAKSISASCWALSKTISAARGPLMLAVQNDPIALTRVAVDALNMGNLYISEARVVSVFLYDSFHNLVGEIKNPGRTAGRGDQHAGLPAGGKLPAGQRRDLRSFQWGPAGHVRQGSSRPDWLRPAGYWGCKLDFARHRQSICSPLKLMT